MRKILVFLLGLLLGVSVQADVTNVVIYLEVERGDGSRSQQRVVLEDWVLEGSSNGIPRAKMKRIEVESGGIISHGRGKFKGADMEVEDPAYGLIGSVSNATYGTSKWLYSIDQVSSNTANLILIKIASSPEISMAERKTLLDGERARRAQIRVDFNQAGQLLDKVNVIAELLYLKDPE